MKKIIFASLAALTICATAFAQKEAQIFKFKKYKTPVYYGAVQPIDQVNDCELAIVIVHGWNGGVRVNTNIKVINEGLPDAYIISPMFPSKSAFKKRKVELDDRAIWNNSWTGNLKLPGLAFDDWRAGGDADNAKISSFDVIDHIFAQLSNKKNYPNLKRVVLTGFSGGGQFVSRYVAVGKGKIRKGITLEYVSLSPSTDFRYEKDVPWLWGLKDRPRYSAKLSEKKIMDNLCSRRCWKGCGDLDVKEKSLDKTPWAMTQGENRYDRFLNLEKYLDQYPEWKKNVSFYTFKGIAHESSKAYRDSNLLRFFAVGDAK